MTRAGADLVADVLGRPGIAASWAPAQWASLVQQARAAGLLGRVAALLQATAGVVPPREAAGHFESALRLWRAQQDEIRREVKYLVLALADLGAPVVLLKGAAYVMAALPPAQGRMFSDVDILVPKGLLPRVESQLQAHGWKGTHQTPYDQRYYRVWMHELPPMQHIHRGTTLDVHHAILPETARLRPDPRKLLERARPLPGLRGVQTLAPEDMVLHSMTHLFLNDDTSHALRDLSDLDLLLRHHGGDPAGGERFWTELPRRAAELDLTRPLYYGLRHTSRLLGTPVPAAVLQAVRAWAPNPALGTLMDAIWARALRAPLPQGQPAGTEAARFALYVRGHWLRMPPVLLTRHLATKAWQRLASPAGDEPRTVG